MATHLERERKFDVSSDFSVPDLGDARTEGYDLEATYFDTADGALQAQGVTLRHRTGGDDAGWHAKVPHPEGKQEHRAGGEAGEPPEGLTVLLRGLRFDCPVERRAVLRTARRVHSLCSAQGGLVAEVADDRVTAHVEGSASATSWRELEIELGPEGTDDTMAELSELVTAGGAVPSIEASKYARAVGEPAHADLPGLAGLVDDYLQTQYRRLARGDLRMRCGENAVHKTRVAVRRIRSTLRIFAPLFDEGRAARLDGKLRWYAGVLGAVRDLDVFGDHLEEDLASVSCTLVPASGPGGLLARADDVRERRWQQVLRTIDGERYGELLRELDEWRRDPPWTPESDADAERVGELAQRARKKSDKRLRKARKARAEDRGEAWHRARKAAKRTRYAAELARPALGKKAAKLARKLERRQDRLGEIQDERMMVETLRDLATSAPADEAFTCGVLAQRHADALEAAYPD